MSMRIYIGIAAGVLAILACVGFLYSGNQNWSSRIADLTMCIEQKLELGNQINHLKLEIANSKQQLAALEHRDCPPCPQQHCPACPSQSCPPCHRLQCWGNTPLYLPGFDCSSCDMTTPAQWPWKAPADICSYLSLGGCCHYRHLLGFDFQFSPQFGWADLMMLDFAFTGHPNLKNIVEFGTYFGVTSLYLGLMSRIRAGHFKTFDISEKRHHLVSGAWLSNMEYIEVNLLTMPIDERIITTVGQDNTLFFFDNGDKTTECNRFLQYVQKGKNVLCTHDWDIEVSLPVIQESLNAFGWEPWAHKHAEMLGAHVRCFRKKNFQY